MKVENMKANKRIIATILVTVVAIIPRISDAKPKGNATPASVAFVNDVVQEALNEALAGPNGEYAAYATYQAVIDKYGKKLPYTNIQEAELRHISALKRQFEKYGLAIPNNPYLGKVTAPKSLLEAAQQGVKTEKENIAMYDRLLKKVKAYPDLTRVFTNLQRASRENHLPAFQTATDANGECPAGCRNCQPCRR